LLFVADKLRQWQHCFRISQQKVSVTADICPLSMLLAKGFIHAGTLFTFFNVREFSVFKFNGISPI
jgi:hypothetical protein